MRLPLQLNFDIATWTRDWKRASTLLMIALIVLVVMYWSTLKSLIWVWSHDGTYQYAFFIFPLSFWLVYGLRYKLQAITPHASHVGVLAVVALSGIWLLGHLFSVNLPQHFAFVAFFPALVLAILGWRAMWVLRFPLAYLLFAVPWSDALVGPLQDITARIAVHVLELGGTPVLLNGREIVTPLTTWLVADACSGVKFFIACTALGCLYAYLMYWHWWKRLLFVALAAIVPVIANGLRVYFTVLIGETWGIKYATGTDHLIFGWQFFGTVLFLLLLVGWWFRDPPVKTQVLTGSSSTGVPRHSWVAGAAILMLFAGPVIALNVKLPSARDVTLTGHAPMVPGWQGPQSPSLDWHPVFKGASGHVLAAYHQTTGQPSVELYHAIYIGLPSRGHDLVTYGNSVYDPADAHLLVSISRNLKVTADRTVSIRELRLSGARLVWYWYCVNKYCTDSPVAVKFLQTWNSIRGRELRSSVWAVSALKSVNGSSAATLTAFVQALFASSSSPVSDTRPDTMAGHP